MCVDSHLPYFSFLHLPFPHLELVLFALFLVPFLCYVHYNMYLLILVLFFYICYFDLLWGFPWLSALLLLSLIPPFACCSCSQQHSLTLSS